MKEKTNKTLTFAIGDVHGCLDQVVQMLAKIDAVIKFNQIKYEHFRIIFLGDYVDRGPNSKGVLDLFMTLNKNPRAHVEYIFLRGNHEEMLLASINPDNFSLSGGLLSNGEAATLRSFGVNRFDEIPYSYVDFIMRMPFYYEDDLHVYVHAGLDPNEPDMSKQDRNTLVWIREPFVNSRFKMFKFVAHGHTPYDPTYGTRAWENKVNLDTACVFGGDLTCAIFDDEIEKPIDYLTVQNRELLPLGA